MIKQRGLPMGWPAPVQALYSVLLKEKGKVQRSPDRAGHWCSAPRTLVTVTIITSSRRAGLDISWCMVADDWAVYVSIPVTPVCQLRVFSSWDFSKSSSESPDTLGTGAHHPFWAVQCNTQLSFKKYEANISQHQNSQLISLFLFTA